MKAGPVSRIVERPLDDGVRYGPEPWRTIDGIMFCHWDRWFLRLAIAEPGGLRAIAVEFRRRTRVRRAGGSRDEAEAMIAQVTGLESRLAFLGRAPHEVLDDVERASEWLWKKAFRRVWHDGPNRRTEAMGRTARCCVSQRPGPCVVTGRDSQCSPAKYEPEAPEHCRTGRKLLRLLLGGRPGDHAREQDRNTHDVCSRRTSTGLQLIERGDESVIDSR